MEKNDQSLHEKFVVYGANTKTWMRKCILLLPEISQHAIWQKKGFGSIYEYAAKLAGMSRNTVDDALRILEKIENKPNLRLVAEHKGLGAVRPVAALATSENEKFWARKAAGMSKNTLETYVREYRKQKVFDAPTENNSTLDFRPGTEFQSREENECLVNGHGCLPVAGGVGAADAIVEMTAVAGAMGEATTAMRAEATEAVTLSMTLNRQTAETLQKLKGQGDWNSLMQELLQLREEKLAAGEPESIENAKRYIPARIKNHVLQKTNGQCAYPGCNKAYNILHHTQRFALERIHDPRRLVPLCKGHEQIAHKGLIGHEEEAPEKWRVRQEADREKVSYGVDRKVMQ